jgi:hypothetical protein
MYTEFRALYISFEGNIQTVNRHVLFIYMAQLPV